jgi:hypothetical protein
MRPFVGDSISRRVVFPIPRLCPTTFIFHTHSGASLIVMDRSQTSNKIMPLASSMKGVIDDVASTRSSRFWFKDGNIILQTGNTRFKVHQGALARHSSVFDDVFSMPQPDPVETQNTTSDCPLLVVHDQPEDIEFALEVFYGDRCLPTSIVTLYSWLIRISSGHMRKTHSHLSLT